MSALSETFTYDLKGDNLARARGGDVALYAMLTSRFMVAIFLGCLVLSVIAFGLQIIYPTPEIDLNGFSFLFLSIGGSVFLIFLFGLTFFPYRVQPQRPVNLLAATDKQFVNMVHGSSFELMKVLRRELHEKNTSLVGDFGENLFSTPAARDFLERLELDGPTCQAEIKKSIVPALSLGEFAHNALNIAAHSEAEGVEVIHALAVFFLHPKLQPFLRQQKLQESDIWFMVSWQEALLKEKARKARWWDKERLLRFSGIGLSWAAGVTPFIDRLGHLPAGNLWDTAYSRETEVDELITSLARSEEHNVLLVGHPGVGRLGVVKELAARISVGQAHPELNKLRLVYVHVGQLLSLAASGPQQLTVVFRALKEMERAGNVIAVLDGVSSILGGSKDAGVDLTDVLTPFFSSASIRVIVIMSNDEYYLRMESNDELMHLFDVIHIKPLSGEATLGLLALSVSVWERRTGMFLPYKTLREVITDTSHIMPQVPYPEKAFDVLEEAIVKAQSHGLYAVQPYDVQTMIASRIGVDTSAINPVENEKLLNLEDVIHERVVNQEKGVAAVARAMIRARAGVRTLSRPIGTFLFLGPSGVGKTETAKALSEAYFGADSYMQRLDMSEYQTEDAVQRLIGNMEHPVGNLTKLITEHPFTVLLLDEFEKASLAVQQLFLQVLDEGRLSDARAQEYSFKHAIIIATSNAGAEFIREHVDEAGNMPAEFEKQLRDYVLSQGLFRPELLNRFDGVITFVPLSRQHIRTIARLMLVKLNQRLDKQHGTTVIITPELLDFLGEIGYNAEFGARPMARAIQDTVEYAVAEKVMRGQVTPGKDMTLVIEELRALVKNN